MNIDIQVIPESEQRAEVNGADWYWETEFTCACGNRHVERGEFPFGAVDSHCTKCDQTMKQTLWLRVRVSPMSDPRYETLLAIHEAVEAIMCRQHGVTQAQVDAFDLEYDKTHTFDVNAGDEPNCPYRREHSQATAIERILAAELDVAWKPYDDELASSYPGPSKKPKPNPAEAGKRFEAVLESGQSEMVLCMDGLESPKEVEAAIAACLKVAKKRGGSIRSVEGDVLMVNGKEVFNRQRNKLQIQFVPQ